MTNVARAGRPCPAVRPVPECGNCNMVCARKTDVGKKAFPETLACLSSCWQSPTQVGRSMFGPEPRTCPQLLLHCGISISETGEMTADRQRQTIKTWIAPDRSHEHERERDAAEQAKALGAEPGHASRARRNPEQRPAAAAQARAAFAARRGGPPALGRAAPAHHYCCSPITGIMDSVAGYVSRDLFSSSRSATATSGTGSFGGSFPAAAAGPPPAPWTGWRSSCPC